jgi:murein DD-endopeptidase MepM/ murein hydrolase activator NlpD
VTNERELRYEMEGLEQASRALTARIQSLQSSAPVAPTSGAVSSAGMIWPVSGPVTSGFGWRWGRMHQGVDIAAPSGTPIAAAASGRVIYAAWMSGYGNLVVVDHGGGLATAYAHLSGYAAGVGQGVAQGQTIGYVGCTGNCFGDHVHFEVRVNGSPVDPLGYL